MCLVASQARELSESLGIPVSCMLPVKNYSEELELDQDADILLFTAVEQMLNYADSFFENQDTEDAEVHEQLDLYRSNHQPLQGFSERTEHNVVWKTATKDKTIFSGFTLRVSALCPSDTTKIL